MKQKVPGLVLLLSFLLFCYGFLLGGLQLSLVSIAEHFGIGTLGMGSLVSLLHVSATIAPTAMGVVADRVGKKVVLVAFALVFAFGCLSAALSATLVVYLISTLFMGAGYSVCESITSAVCVDLSKEKGTGYVNLTQCLCSMGAILGPIVLTHLPALSIPRWRLLFFICAAGFILSALCLMRCAFPASTLPREKAPIFNKTLLKSPIFLAMAAGILIYVGLETGLANFIEILFREKGQADTFGAYGISVFWAGVTVSRFFFGIYPYRPKRTVRLCFGLAAVLFFGLIGFHSGLLCVILCGCIGFLYGPIWTSFMAGGAEAFPQYSASATGLMSTSCGLGGILYPILMGAIADTLGIYAGFVILAISAVLGSVVSFALKNTKPNTP